MKTCPECEIEFESAICPECECVRQFTELENNSLRLSDNLSDCLSDLHWAKQGIAKYEDAVKEVRKLIEQNNVALRDFKWWTQTMREEKEM